LEQVEHELQFRPVKTVDQLHDLFLRLGDLSSDEVAARDAGAFLPALIEQRRVIKIADRYIAVEDASRYRDALGVPIPAGVPERYLQPVADPLGDLVLRYARTHGPFTPSDVAQRHGLGVAVVTAALERFVERGRLVEGEFRPGGT